MTMPNLQHRPATLTPKPSADVPQSPRLPTGSKGAKQLPNLTLKQTADVVALLHRYDVLNHLTACYFGATSTLGEHPAAREHLSTLLDELQKDAEPLLGRFPNSQRFITAMELLK